MRAPALAATLLALTACGQPPSPAAATVPASQQAAPPTLASAAQPNSVEGWATDITDFASMGSSLPAFSAKGGLTQETLRGHWTILGFISEPAGGKDEATYAAAIVSAADQDPTLDVIWALTTPTATPPASPPAPAIDAAELSKSLNITQTPAYLLIGPDLTIEGYRGALSKTTDDGIKSVIRGVAQIRKQIAAPE